jgi:hypothetical protein
MKHFIPLLFFISISYWGVSQVTYTNRIGIFEEFSNNYLDTTNSQATQIDSSEVYLIFELPDSLVFSHVNLILYDSLGVNSIFSVYNYSCNALDQDILFENGDSETFKSYITTLPSQTFTALIEIRDEYDNIIFTLKD